MSEIAWKCYRCNLSFKDQTVAEIHKKIAGHAITKVKQIAA
jgi:protein required for attachment to host cells